MLSVRILRAGMKKTKRLKVSLGQRGWQLRLRLKHYLMVFLKGSKAGFGRYRRVLKSEGTRLSAQIGRDLPTLTAALEGGFEQPPRRSRSRPGR